MPQPSMSSATRSRSGSIEERKSSQDENCAASLRRSFRSFVSSLIVAARSAEKLSHVGTAANNGTGKSTQESQSQFDSAVKIILQQRQSVRQTASLLEGKLRGNAKESEALLCSLQSLPCVGVKRKLECSNDLGNKRHSSGLSA